ncbi:unnamed protein product, partial [Lampetra planeri]
MDVKLGQRSYDPFASQEKREQQIKKYPLMEEMGFLVLGMRVYKLCSDSFDTYDQHYGRGLGKDTIKDGLAEFFSNGVGLRKDAVSASIHRVQHILRWFESQRQLVFYASSLLFVYEGLPSSVSSPPFSLLRGGPIIGPKAGDTGWGGVGRARQDGTSQKEEVAESNNNNIQAAMPWDYSTIYANHRKGGHPPLYQKSSPWQHSSRRRRRRRSEEEMMKGQESDATERSRGGAEVEVRMIDFAHVFPSETHDHGYIYGLRHLLTVLEQILCD